MPAFQPDTFQGNAFDAGLTASNETIYTAFCQRVVSLAQYYTPALSVAFPAANFTPPSSGFWLEVQWFPNETVNYGIGFDAGALMRGFGQITVCCRPGIGIVSPMSLADDAIAHFDKGTQLANAIVYKRPWASSIIQDPERVSIHVTIPYHGGDR